MGTDSDGHRPRELPPGVSVKPVPEGVPVIPSPDGGAGATGEGTAGGTRPERAASALNTSRSFVDPAAAQSEQVTVDCGSPFQIPKPNAIATKLNRVLALWHYHTALGFRGVPHFIDDDMHVLEEAATDSRQVPGIPTEEIRTSSCGFAPYASSCFYW